MKPVLLLEYTDFSKKVYLIKYGNNKITSKDKIYCSGMFDLLKNKLEKYKNHKIYYIIEQIKRQNNIIEDELIFLNLY